MIQDLISSDTNDPSPLNYFHPLEFSINNFFIFIKFLSSANQNLVLKIRYSFYHSILKHFPKTWLVTFYYFRYFQIINLLLLLSNRQQFTSDSQTKLQTASTQDSQTKLQTVSTHRSLTVWVISYDKGQAMPMTVFCKLQKKCSYVLKGSMVRVQRWPI